MVATYADGFVGLAYAFAALALMGFCMLVGGAARPGRAKRAGFALLLLLAGLFVSGRLLNGPAPAALTDGAAISVFADERPSLPEPLPADKLLAETPRRAAGEIPVEADGPFQIVYPSDRPEWVRRADDNPRLESGEVVEITVSSGPHVSWGEARRELSEQVDKAAARYVNDYLGIPDAASHLKFTPRRVEGFEEEPLYSIGRMKQAHALLTFDKEFNRQIERKWRDHVATTRLVRTGLAAALVLGALSVVYGYFTADASTRGAHRRRLRWGAGAAMTALVALAAVFFRWIS